MKKVLFSLLMIIPVMIINCNVKAYDLTSLTNSDYKVTINSVNVNLYPVPEETQEDYVFDMYANPISFPVALNENGLNITSDSLTNKNMNIDTDSKLNMDLISFGNTFSKETLSAFLESQNFDKTKKYYGDIDITYTVSDYPTKYKTFIEYNTFRAFIQTIVDLSNEFGNNDTGIAERVIGMSLAKPGYKVITLDGNPFTTTQTLNFFTYNPEATGTETSTVNRVTYYNDALVNGDDAYEDDGYPYSYTSESGIYGLNFGVFSEETTFDGSSFKPTDKAVIFSVMNRMDSYIDSVNNWNFDDYIEHEVDNYIKKSGNSIGTMVAKVPNTQADSNKINILIGLILLLVGGLVVRNIIERKRYN